MAQVFQELGESGVDEYGVLLSHSACCLSEQSNDDFSDHSYNENGLTKSHHYEWSLHSSGFKSITCHFEVFVHKPHSVVFVQEFYGTDLEEKDVIGA
jgi:hypothetical protein